MAHSAARSSGEGRACEDRLAQLGDDDVNPVQRYQQHAVDVTEDMSHAQPGQQRIPAACGGGTMAANGTR